MSANAEPRTVEEWRAAYFVVLKRATSAEAEREQLTEALYGVSNAYGCFAGCTGALRSAPADGSGHTPACLAARAALANVVSAPRSGANRKDVDVR